jgi:SWI/SNF-related matrix-associated actin-dependent regulator 1 of chromatin subfamily A
VATAELVAGNIILHTEYRERDLIRQVPGAKWKADAKEWRVPFSWTACLILRGIFRDRLEIGPKLIEHSTRLFTERVAPTAEARARALDMAADVSGNAALYPYQRTGVDFLVKAGSAILADEMGTGKTAQTIQAVEQLEAFPALVICPNGLKRTWQEEYAKWAPHRDVVIVQGSAAKRRAILEEDHDVYIINWESLRYHSRLAGYGSIKLSDKEKELKELNLAWGAVIADEAHKAKAPKAKQTRALWAVGSLARHRFALTGTPVANTPEDLWSLLHFVAPEEWPARSKYIDRFCHTAWNAFGGIDVLGIKPEVMGEFYGCIDTRFLRRPKALVLPWLPPKVYETRYVEMTPKQRAAYKQLEKESIADLPGGTLLSFEGLSTYARLTQFASAAARLEGDDVVLEMPSSKVEALCDLLEEMGNEPLVVFAASKQLINLAEARMDALKITCARITGDEHTAVRDRAKDDFMAGRVRVLFATLAAGSEGLTLTRAATLAFLNRSASLIQNLQAEDRIHRPGQEAEKVTIIDFVAPGTIEEDNVALLASKRDKAEEINRDKKAVAA